MTQSRIARTLTALVLCALVATSAVAQSSESYLFHIVLLIAGGEGGESLDDLSENAREALDDVRSFLPFKSYSLLDTALIRSNRQGNGVLRGPHGQEYRVQISFGSDRDNEQKLMFHSFRLMDRGLPQEESQPKMLIESSFSIMAGETIVVGTSKLNGGEEALVVLLSAN